MYFIIISKTSVRWMSVYKETIDEKQIRNVYK